MHLGYDAAGNLTTYCDGNGTVTYGYDAANELTSIQQPGGNCSVTPVTGACTLISYVDSNGTYQDGRRTQITFPPATTVTETMSYDNAGNLTSIVGKRGTATVSSFTYSYANGTNDLAQRQSVTTPSGTTYFHYDAFGELCYYTSTSSTNACSSPPSGATSFNYDADGNRTSMVSGGTTTSYAYNAADELCATSTSGSASCSSPNYTWDADGNMLSSPTISSLSYNSKNQTTGVTYSGNSETLSYADADQTERVTEGNVTEAWSPLGLSEETNSFGSYYYLRDNQGNPLGEYHAANYYFLTDGLDSITNVISGADGSTTKTYTYDPFGNVTETGSGTTTDLRYTGGNSFWNKASSNPGSPPLYQLGTRYYDAASGRWTQQDPIGGDNAYDYAGEDPIDNTDPSGACVLCSNPLGIVSGAKVLWRRARPYVRGCLKGAFAGALYGSLTFTGVSTVGGAVVGCATEVGATLLRRRVGGNLGQGAALALEYGAGLYGSYDSAVGVAELLSEGLR